MVKLVRITLDKFDKIVMGKVNYLFDYCGEVDADVGDKVVIDVYSTETGWTGDCCLVEITDVEIIPMEEIEQDAKVYIYSFKTLWKDQSEYISKAVVEGMRKGLEQVKALSDRLDEVERK